MPNLSEEEHHARAMLLGMQYRADIGVYHVGNRSKGEVRDAMTLKVIPFQQAVERFGHERYNKYPSWYPHT